MSDRTIFCLGGRGHHGNATSDLLRFFIDGNEAHGLGRVFLDSLLVAADGRIDFVADGALGVDREVVTADRERVAMVVESDASLLVVETEHWAAIGRPLDDYARRTRERAARTGKRAAFVVLGCRVDDAAVLPAPWVHVSYESYLVALRAALTDAVCASLDERWRVLTREFVDHLALEAGVCDDRQRDAMLATLANRDGRLTARQRDDAVARHVPHVARRLAAALDEGMIREGEWSDADRGHGWEWGRALDFQILDRKAADAFVSLAVRYSLDGPLDEAQLVLVAWVRPNARRAGVDGRTGEVLKALGFERICAPAVRRWESAVAYARAPTGMSLDDAIRDACAAARAIRAVMGPWSNAADLLPLRA